MIAKFIKVIVTSVVILLSFKAAAMEPLKADCIEDSKAHRYEFFLGSNSEVIADGWGLESWWDEDTIIWDGGDTVLLNYGNLSATVLSAEGTVLRAIVVNDFNVYILTLDTSLNRAALTQHQTANWGPSSRNLKARTAGLKCTFKTIDLGY